jgi:hypothetical protein
MNWLDNLSKEMKVILGAVTCLVTFAGIFYGFHEYLDDRYALAEALKQTQQRLDQKIVSDQLNQVQQRIWLLEDRHGKHPTDKTVAEEYRTLNEQKRELSEELKKKK